MKRMMMNGLHLGEKLRNVLHAPKRTEKEQNAGKTNPAQCPIEEKQDMTDEEVLDFLIPKMLECMKKKIDPLPEQGKFDSHSVSITYPGTTCEAYLNYTYDPIDGGDRNRRLRVAMRHHDSDRVVSFYLFKGSKAECLAWLEQPGILESLKKDYAELYTSVKEAED